MARLAWLFVSNVWAHHFSWVGIVLTVLGVGEIVSGKKWVVSPKWALRLGAIFLFIACSQAWFDEHRNVETLIGEKASLSGQVGQLHSEIETKNNPILLQFPPVPISKAPNRLPIKPSIQQTSSGPQSPNIVGNGNQFTVINPENPGRRIPVEARAQLIQFLSEKPGRVRILVVSSNGEAFRFAKDWYEVLKAAGWKIEGDEVSPIVVLGGTQFGMTINYRGEPVPLGQTGQAPAAEPIGHLVTACNTLKIPFYGQRLPNIEEGLVVLNILASPPN